MNPLCILLTSLHFKVRKEVKYKRYYRYSPTNKVPQNLSIDSETSGQNLNLSGIDQLSEVDELVIKTISSNHKELTDQLPEIKEQTKEKIYALIDRL